MEKLKNNLIQNQEKWPEIFGITEEEVLELREATIEYKNGQSYSDWSKMYSGIHRESTFEESFRNWLACYRYMKQKQKPIATI